MEFLTSLAVSYRLSGINSSYVVLLGVIMEFVQTIEEERGFGEFRRKVRDSELLSASLEKLLSAIHFTGRVSVVVQNGRVLKSGYEEGYFRSRPE
jgi:hypothetical protein